MRDDESMGFEREAALAAEEIGAAVAGPSIGLPGARGGRLPGAGVALGFGVGGVWHGFSAVGAGAVFASLDAALAEAVKRPGAVVAGDALGGGRFEVFDWVDGDVDAPAVLSVSATAAVCAAVVGGELYCPADPLAPGERWVCVPGMADVYALPAEARAAHHGACCRVWNAWSAAPALPRAVEALAWPVVWLLVASHPDAVPVRRVERGGVDRGGVCSGLTRPILMPERGEPAVYLPVISRKEGPRDAVNGWDVGAGISVGAVQFNVIGGHLFALLARVFEGDRALFEACFGALGWSMVSRGGRPVLRVARAEGVIELGHLPQKTVDEERTQIARNAGYLQSGDPTRTGVGDIDPEWRRDLTARFRALALWPHAQRWIEETSAGYLAPGLRKLAAGGVPAVDCAKLDDEAAYALRAVLLSAYVRYSASLDRLVTHLGSGTAAARLGRLDAAIDKLGAESAAWAERAANLRERLPAQRGHAREIHAARPRRGGA